MAQCKYWMHGFGGEPKTTAAALKAAGFDCVVASGAANIQAVNAAGMESWLCGGAFGLGAFAADDAVKAVNVAGGPRAWFGSGCPNNPKLREQNLESYRQMATTPGVEGILVDGCRFASPASGLGAFLTCFCDTCRVKAAKLGLDFEAMKRDVAALHGVFSGKDAGRGRRWTGAPVGAIEWLTERPGVLDWLRFRRLCITEHFRAVDKIIHGAGLRMGVYIFTPCLAPLVGQSYVDLRGFVDVFAPMIYRNYPTRPGEACLNWELTLIPEELGLADTPAETHAMGLVLAWTGLSGIVKAGTINDVRNALPPEAVGHETAQARELIGPEKELAPIIYIDDPLMKKTAEAVRANGANGVNFFVYKDNWADLVRAAVEK